MVDTTLSPFLALHALQAVPASLLNRDDLGSVKKITLGGVPRVRVSSQSWKRSIRVGLRSSDIDGGAFGLRTNRFPRLVAAELAGAHGIHPDRAAVVTGAVFAAAGLKLNADTGNTAVSVFATADLPRRVAAVIAEHNDAIVAADTAEAAVEDEAQPRKARRTAKKKDDAPAWEIPAPVRDALLDALKVGDTIDLALFGRMLSEIPGENVDGAVAVAHAFSVDPLALEPDFFTAVDDAAADGEAVSNMLDTTELTAPTLYRYAELDRRQLRANLAAASDDPALVEQLARDSEAAFIEWFVRALPSGKHRSTAAHTLPLLVLAEPARFAYSLADAFADAITGDTVIDDACRRLLEHQRAARRFSGSATTVALPINPTATARLDFTGFAVADGIEDLTAQVQK